MDSDRVNKLKTLLEQSPADTFLNHAMGVEQAKSGNDELAIAYFEKVLEIDGDYLGTYYQLAKCYERMGAIEKAFKTYESGLEVASKNGDQKTMNEIMMAKEDLEDEQ